MAVTAVIGNKAARESAARKLYKDDKSFRADRLVEAWAKVPEIGEGLMNLPESVARSTAVNLQQEASLITRMSEAQKATAFDGQKPENMLRLTRLAMPAAIRNQVFTEMALESMYDSIKYFRPKLDKNFKGTNNMSLRNSDGDFDASHKSDPWGMNGDDDFNGDTYQKALYEQTGDRFVQELANGYVGAKSGESFLIGGKEVTIGTLGTPAVAAHGEEGDDDYVPAQPAVPGGTVIVFGKPAKQSASNEFDLGYRDGYAVIFGKNEKDTIAFQQRNGNWFVNSVDHPGVSVVPAKDDKGNEILGAFEVKGLKEGDTVKAYGRYDSESDFEGDNIGQLKLGMATYKFEPRPIEIGISFSMLSDVTLDVTFGVSVEDELMNYGAQEIKASMDRQAFKLAYHAVKTNPAAYRITFDCGWYDDASHDANQKRGYIENAQTFTTAILKVADVMLNDIKRGGVSRMVGGPSAISYLSLINGFTPAGDVSFVGPHKFGEVNNIPVFKVSSDIIDTADILCVWKNDQVEGDVSLIFGTLIPFISTGLINRATFYSEAGLASIGDYQVLNKKYLTLIRLINLKDYTDN